MYTLRLWDITGTACLATLHDAAVKNWSNRVSSPGRFQFSLPASSTNIALLQSQLVVTLERRDEVGDDVPEWVGYLESHKKTDKAEHTAFCAGALQLFRKRKTLDDETFTGGGSDEAFDLLTDTNGDFDTGIVAGTGGVAATANLKATGRKDLLAMWTDIAAATGAEFAVSFTLAALSLVRSLDFVPSMGTDKSASVTLRFRRDGDPGNNVEGLEEGEDGEPMATRVIGTSAAGGGLEYVYDDPLQSTYGLLVEEKAFNEAQDLATLTALTTAYGQQRANPITDYQVAPILAEKRVNTITGERQSVGLQYGDLVPGDLVTCDFVTESGTVQAVRRIAEVLVDV
ncbi:MAG TPA: hypothetical protein VD866_00800, partial [Urbifossiella sp.]|nr:hypothetical protein [Urbifossiella sp.]